MAVAFWPTQAFPGFPGGKEIQIQGRKQCFLIIDRYFFEDCQTGGSMPAIIRFLHTKGSKKAILLHYRSIPENYKKLQVPDRSLPGIHW